MNITVTVTKSSHPDYDLFGTTTIKGRQLTKRGSQAEIDAWYDTIATAAAKQGWTVTLVNG